MRRGAFAPSLWAVGRSIESATPVQDAIDCLDSMGALVSPEAAVSYLEELSGRVNIIGLYKHFFPEQFAASTAPLVHDKKDPEYISHRNYHEGEPHTPREEEFFKLVDDNLFPLPRWWLDDGARFDEIYILNPLDEWEDEEADDFKTPFQLAGMFITNGRWTTIEDIARGLEIHSDGPFWPQPAEIPRDGWRLFWPAFEKLSRESPTPLSFIDDAINVMGYSTGVIFMDHHCGCGGCECALEWTKENVEELTAQHARGREILGNLDVLDGWIKEDPLNRLRSVIGLWNSAAGYSWLKGDRHKA